MYRKRNTAIFIDGENVSAKKADVIMAEARKRGTVDSAKVYGLQNDNCTRAWTEVARDNIYLKDIRLSGGPCPNKVDRKIKKDIFGELRKSANVDIVILVSSDHGYTEDVKKLRNMGKRVIVIGEEKTRESLRNACSEFVLI